MNNTPTTMRVGIVIPTLGTRVDYLRQSIDSIRKASSGTVFVLLVAPSDFQLPDDMRVDDIAIDTGNGLAAAINLGISSLPSSVEYVNWLGDDDLLAAGSIDLAVSALDASNAPFVFGRCNYIDHAGRLLFLNRSGAWAVRVMRFGPQLVPQPGAIFRRSAFTSAGGLNAQFNWAFDLDIFIRLSRTAQPIFLPQTLASFRWHDDSLSVGGRRGSVNEASQIRRNNLHPLVRRFSFLWELFVRELILLVGQRIKTPMKAG
jgi:glycosyltransferase involved in cell wall biosynthesis